MTFTLTDEEKQFIVETCGSQCLEFMNHLKTGCWSNDRPKHLDGWKFLEGGASFYASHYVNGQLVSVNDVPSSVRMYTTLGERTIRFEWSQGGMSLRIPGPALIVIKLDDFVVEQFYSVSDRNTWESFEEWINHPLVINHKLDKIMNSLK